MGLAMPLLPPIVGSSLTVAPIAVRIRCIHGLRGPAEMGVLALELEALSETTRSCPRAGDGPSASVHPAATAAATTRAARARCTCPAVRADRLPTKRFSQACSSECGRTPRQRYG